MRFNCSGHITGWSAHTLILTLPNFVEHLTHIITFQVWRSANLTAVHSYILVGSNRLEFSDPQLIRAGIRRIPGQNNTAYFNFTNKFVPPEDQIHFMPGDVLGWFVSPQRSNSPPLSILYYKSYNAPVSTCVMHIQHYEQEPCMLCNIEQRNTDRIMSVMPFVSAIYGKKDSKESVCRLCSTLCHSTNILSFGWTNIQILI